MGMITFKQFLNEETVDQYIDRLVKTLKIKKLGSGAFASVFQHPVYHNVAVKIFEYDPMYVKYIKICQKSTNPWLPRVVSIHKIRMDEVETWRHRNYGDKIKKIDSWIVFFEKLRPVKKAELKAATQKFLAEFPDSDFDFNDRRSWFEASRGSYESFEELSSSTWQQLAKIAKNPEIKEVAKILDSVRANDIHDGNVMVRSDGQVVFTDPVAS